MLPKLSQTPTPGSSVPVGHSFLSKNGVLWIPGLREGGFRERFSFGLCVLFCFLLVITITDTTYVQHHCSFAFCECFRLLERETPENAPGAGTVLLCLNPQKGGL